MTIANDSFVLAPDILAIQTSAAAAAAQAYTALLNGNAAAANASSALVSAVAAQTQVATHTTQIATLQTQVNSAAAAANTALNSVGAGLAPPLTLQANITGLSAPAAPTTLQAMLDAVFGATVGGQLQRSTAGWYALPPGLAGQVMYAGGLGKPNYWGSLPNTTVVTPTAPGGTPTLTFGTATTTTLPVTASGATGTITQYQVLVSLASGMTFPQLFSSTTAALTLTGLAPNTTYYTTVQAFNGTVGGTVSAVQNHTTATGTVVVQPTVSASGTTITPGVGSIYDANGVTWTITTGGIVAVNGTNDGTTSNVTVLEYYGGNIYMENASNLWWFKATPAAAWVQTTAPGSTTVTTGSVLPGGSTNPAVTVPLTGPITVPSMTYLVYNGMGYILIPPANFDPTKRYPLVVYMHQDDMGNPYYTGGGQKGDAVGPQIAPWFLNTGFLANVPCFLIAPLCNQTAQTSDGQINFGGYGDGVQVAQTNTIQIIKNTIAAYPIDTARIYPIGNSMGGTGAIVQMILNNSINGTQGKIFAAALALSGVDYDGETGSSVTTSVVTQFAAGVPLISIHGATDTDQPALDFDLPLFNQLGGTGGNANGMALTKAGTSNFYLLIDASLGHDTWDTYFAWPKAQPYFAQLFSYSASTGAVVVTPPASFTPSANDATVTTVGPALTDATGYVWTITAGLLMALNGTPLSNTANLKQLAYVNGVIWQQNTALNWYSVISVSGGAVTFSAGTTVSPLPSGGGGTVTPGPNFSVVGGKIYDPAGVLHVAKGVNTIGVGLSTISTNAAAQPLTTFFPGINHVRLPIYPSDPGKADSVYPAPSTYLTFVQQLTGYSLTNGVWTKVNNNGIVVEIEDHNQDLTYYQFLPPYTGAALTVQLNWYAAMATYYAGNPYVWLGGPNEINSSDGSYSQAAIAAISTWESQIYNAIRNTGNTNMIQFMAGVGGSNIGTVGVGGGFTASLYANMTNICWEIHCYYSSGDSEGSIYNTAAGYVNGGTAAPASGAGGGWGIIGAQTIQSKDGVVPVIIGEWGSDSGNQATTEASLITAAVLAAQSQGVGATAWAYWGYDTQWALIGSNGALTTWGNEVAAII